jgi:glycosyltransferase involved in cell wall biosynthesis
MNILMMTNTYTPIIGGVECSINSFAGEFRKQGHQVRIVAPTFKDMPTEEENVVRLPAIQRFHGTDFSINLPVPGALSRVLKDFSPDIIHSHHPFLVGDLALRISSQQAIPIVFTYHTMFEDYVHYLPIQNAMIKRFVVELSAGYADLTHQVLVPSESIKKILLEREVKTPIEVIPTGVDIGRFAKGSGAKFRKNFKIPDDAFVIGHVGRLAPEKNLDFLSFCVANFCRQKKTAHFLVVGEGPSVQHMKTIFRNANMENRLCLTGVLQNQELVDSYHAMDIFAFSSQTETQGLVLVEAMAAGLPIVAVDATGVRDMLRDRVNGRLVDQENEDNFIYALFWFVRRTPQQKEALRQAALTTASEFSIEFCAHKMLQIYKKVISRGHSFIQKENRWHLMMNRIRTEWELLKNIAEAGEAALSEKFH